MVATQPGNVFEELFVTRTLDINQIAAPANPAAGTRRLFVDSGTGELSVRTSGGSTVSLEGAGDLSGPASAINNSIVRFDGTTGKLVQGYTSGAPIIGDTGIVTLVQPLILDDTSLQIQEGVDTLTITVPVLTAARAITFGDLAGEIVLDTAIQTLTLKTLTTPTIASFVNAGHTHANAAGGGLLTTLGTITTGVWNATVIAVLDGGTGASTASGARTNLGLIIGTDVQAFGAILDDLNTLGAPASDGQFIVATGAGAFAYESEATARTSIGLGTSDSPTFAGLAINGLSDFNGNIVRDSRLVRTNVAVAAYTAVANDKIIACRTSSATITITLPTALTVDGRFFIIKDEDGNAATNNITIATEGAQTIDGNATDIISNNYGSIGYYSDGTNWFAI